MKLHVLRHFLEWERIENGFPKVSDFIAGRIDPAQMNPTGRCTWTQIDYHWKLDKFLSGLHAN